MDYSNEQYKYGFWYDILNNTNVKSITRVSETNSSKTQRIACTQLDFEKSQEKIILEEWIKFLPNSEFNQLYFLTHTPQKLLDAIFKIKSLELLYVKWTKTKDISRVGNLSNLKYLYLGQCSNIQNLEFLSNLSKLKVLTIETTRTNDFSFISELHNLQFLNISGGFSKKLRIENLNFVKQLKNLKYLSLSAVILKNHSLSNLTNLSKLVTLNLPVELNTKDKSILHTNCPNLKYGPDYFDELINRNLNFIQNTFNNQQK